MQPRQRKAIRENKIRRPVASWRWFWLERRSWGYILCKFNRRVEAAQCLQSRQGLEPAVEFSINLPARIAVNLVRAAAAGRVLKAIIGTLHVRQLLHAAHTKHFPLQSAIRAPICPIKCGARCFEVQCERNLLRSRDPLDRGGLTKERRRNGVRDGRCRDNSNCKRTGTAQQGGTGKQRRQQLRV